MSNKIVEVTTTNRAIQIEIMREAIGIIQRNPNNRAVIAEQGRLIRKALKILSGGSHE